ncbi:MAG: DEAD/DEAH box helicase family protein [Mariprofundaceae bacterium]
MMTLRWCSQSAARPTDPASSRNPKPPAALAGGVFTVDQLTDNGWLKGEHTHYDRQLALYPKDVIGWIQDSQPEAWEKLSRIHGEDAEKVVLERLAASLASKSGGTVKVLRRGFGVAGGGTIRMSQPMPEDGRNETAMRRYRANRLRIVRQVRYSLDNENAIDLVAFINGIPVATFELKTDFTQSVEAAMHQYRTDRRPKSAKTGRIEPLLAFRRGAVVHFAMSDSEVWMTTKLAGESTRFLPFNKGNDGAAGNPPDTPYPVRYMWEEVMRPDNWLRIFHRFVFIEKKEEETAQGELIYKEAQIFPRYHQWEAVTKMIGAVKREGVGHQYLCEHSAGSGKTNTIAWTAHELIRLRHDDGAPYFNSVIVVTDRTVLDQQLQEAVAQIEHQSGVVKAVDRDKSSLSKSKQLAQALLSGTPIIVVTLQTFPFAMEAILTEQSLRDRNFAVIIDEAHNSQTGSTAGKLRQVLALDASEDLAALTPDEILEKLQGVRGLPKNVSHFAFTATPKHSTLMLFGRPKDPSRPASKENPPLPFHTYTMQQAIEEGFILDVLQNYTSYKTAFRLGQVFTSEERVDAKYAKRALARWLTLHPTNVAQKVELIVEHFRANVAPLLGGQAKAMVVTSSRAAAVKYKLAFDRYVARQGYRGIRSLVAFSGKISGKDINDGIEFRYPDDETFTEENMNPGARGRDLRTVFDTPEYQVMLVANKFQTGFDQPKLCAMYVDKKLHGVECVQTLSRLNRTYPGKAESGTFVLDFFNDPQDILDSFQPYYQTAELADVSDPDLVFDLFDKLRAEGIFTWQEVEQFAVAFFVKNKSNAAISNICKPAVERWQKRYKLAVDAYHTAKEMFERTRQTADAVLIANAEKSFKECRKEKDRLEIFKKDLGSFTRFYEFMSQIVDYDSKDLEKLALYARHLRPLLREKMDEDDDIDLSNVALSHYRLSKIRHQDLVMETEGDYGLKSAGDIGSARARDKKEEFLSQILARLNELFITDGLSDADLTNYAQTIRDKVKENKSVMHQIQNNSPEQAMLGDFPKAIDDAVMDSSEAHQNQMMQVLSNPEVAKGFAKVVFDLIRLGE